MQFVASVGQQKAVFTQFTSNITIALHGAFQPTARDPKIVFLISASILTLVAVTLISALGTTQGRRA